jgi:hypothetical protein
MRKVDHGGSRQVKKLVEGFILARARMAVMLTTTMVVKGPRLFAGDCSES